MVRGFNIAIVMIEIVIVIVIMITVLVGEAEWEGTVVGAGTTVYLLHEGWTQEEEHILCNGRLSVYVVHVEQE